LNQGALSGRPRSRPLFIDPERKVEARNGPKESGRGRGKINGGPDNTLVKPVI